MAEIDMRQGDNITNNQIPSILPAEVMRKSMENKNLLTDKGSIYVGTGETETIAIEDDNYIVAKTAVLSPTGMNDGAILACNAENGLGFKNAGESGFLTYLTDQTWQDGERDKALSNLFEGLSATQQTQVRSWLNAGSAQGINTVIAGDGIEVQDPTPGEEVNPTVSVKPNTTQTTWDFASGNYSGLIVDKNGLRVNIGIDKTAGVRQVNSDVSTVGTLNRSYPIQIANSKSNAPGKMFVYIPWANTTYVGGTGLSGGTTSGTKINLKNATSSEIGGVKLKVDSSDYSGQLITFETT